MSNGKMSLGQMSISTMSVGQFSAEKIPFCQNVFRPNVFRQKDVEFMHTDGIHQLLYIGTVVQNTSNLLLEIFLKTFLHYNK